MFAFVGLTGLVAAGLACGGCRGRLCQRRLQLLKRLLAHQLLAIRHDPSGEPGQASRRILADSGHLGVLRNGMHSDERVGQGHHQQAGVGQGQKKHLADSRHLGVLGNGMHSDEWVGQGHHQQAGVGQGHQQPAAV